MDIYTILAIDDQDFNLHFLKQTLHQYNFIGAADAKEALALLETTLPDLILLDVIMPGMNGYDLIKILKSDERTRHIPVIFVTVLDSAEEEEEGFNLGAVDYITKPFNPSIVRARVKNTLRFVHKQRLLEKMAHIDGLTEVPNRRYFEEILEKEFGSAIRNKRYFALLMLDVDYFKHYNDYYGHSKGDEALIRIAKTIMSCLKRPDDFLARYGGEEFAIILPDTDEAGGKKIAEDILQAIRNIKIPHEGIEIAPYLTISLGGYSSIPKYNQTSRSFLEKADQGLYEAKHKGRNRAEWQK
ncbi:MAG: diguanylate cyclase [Peptococcaceae bacterium]|nr:diguanylate cyclase [Peptococcaceae bacterium]